LSKINVRDKFDVAVTLFSDDDDKAPDQLTRTRMNEK
jgi:hypothetical protein